MERGIRAGGRSVFVTGGIMACVVGFRVSSSTRIAQSQAGTDKINKSSFGGHLFNIAILL